MVLLPLFHVSSGSVPDLFRVCSRTVQGLFPVCSVSVPGLSQVGSGSVPGMIGCVLDLIFSGSGLDPSYSF